MVTSRWWALSALVLSVLVIGLDATVLNVALPTLAVDLNASTGELQWIVDAYLVTFAALLLPAGVFGDRLGRKKLLVAGLAAFGVASAVAMLADTTGWLIAGRALMGAGAALIMPLSTSILPSIFPAGERAKAIAVWTAGMAVGLPLGPIVGGYLLDHFWWGSIFLINLPAVAIALVAVVLLVPESRDPASPRLDVPGTLLSVTGLAALVYGVIQAPVDGWGSAGVLIPLVVGLVLLTAFVRVEMRSGTPMMDLSLFRDRVFLWGSIAASLVSLGMMGVLFVVPLYLQAVQGFDAMGTGLRITPMILGLMLGGFAGERLLKKATLRPIMTAGLLLLTAGLALGAILPGEYAYTAAWLTVAGAGVGLTMVPAMDGVLAMLPEHRTGMGTGVLQSLRQTGGAFGVAGLGSLLSAVYAGNLPDSAPEGVRDSVAAAVHVPEFAAAGRDAFAAAMDAVLWTCGAAALLSAVLVAVFMRGTSAKEAGESAHELAGTA
ncbi:DHA2 family efflux MFS transporter permease subunit [Acrocarpospora pleiomorpha]|uniref:DHA2 family efflux MFS transporter permease subunit n=1 Tax=Acrocarpospora pleiomorpha TaxID=90975 RepID=UPI0012D2EFB9|nr:DHA2 family efflux MFS transporter permease subunit [Acrocarpospora pleiomorpha]